MIRKLIAKLTGGTVVRLYDHDHEITFRIAYPYTRPGWDEWLSAYRVSRLWRSGHVILGPDGTVRGRCYVQAWDTV